MKKHLKLFLLLFLAVPLTVQSQRHTNPAFKIIPLGVKGGIDESNLSSYMVAPVGSANYICLDAGTLHFGIERAVKEDLFRTSATNVLRNNIKAYLISHAHLDHVSGLIINSPDDTVKNIYGLPFCLDILKDKYFTWKSWANFANEGDEPTLKKYYYKSLYTEREINISNTGMHVKAFRLSHSNSYESTAFLVRYDSSYLLYFGDTGADEVEGSNNLYRVWKEIAPLIRAKKLKGIFIETSFPNQQPLKQLFGHLTPQLLMSEMRKLSKLTGENALNGFNILITHIKPSGDNEVQIKKQLEHLNKLNLHLIFPQQAKALNL